MADEANIEQLREEIERQQQLLLDVAEFAVNINDVNNDYRDRGRRIRSRLKTLGLDDPNPWPDLWLWRGTYKDDPALGSYQARREHVLRMYQPLLEALENITERRLGTGLGASDTGWTEVDRQVEQLRNRYARAQTPEEYRQVGLLCRDIFLSLGHVVFDPAKHLPDGEPEPKRDDAKKRLDLAVGSEQPGKSGERLRALIRATWEFVQPVIHDQTDDQTRVVIAAEGTVLMVKVLAVLFPTPTGSPPAHENEADDLEDPDEEDWTPEQEDMAYYLTAEWDNDS